MRPVIGIVMCGSENGRQFVSQPYLDAVTDAGGLPTVLPVTGDTSLYAGFSRLCDGFLLSGQTVSPKNPQDELFRCSPEKVRSAAMHSQHTVTLC